MKLPKLTARDKIKPCPFCGSDKIRLLPQSFPKTGEQNPSSLNYKQGDIKGWTIGCEVCTATLRAYGPKKQAVCAWNNRHIGDIS